MHARMAAVLALLFTLALTACQEDPTAPSRAQGTLAPAGPDDLTLTVPTTEPELILESLVQTWNGYTETVTGNDTHGNTHEWVVTYTSTGAVSEIKSYMNGTYMTRALPQSDGVKLFEMTTGAWAEVETDGTVQSSYVPDCDSGGGHPLQPLPIDATTYSTNLTFGAETLGLTELCDEAYYRWELVDALADWGVSTGASIGALLAAATVPGGAGLWAWLGTSLLHGNYFRAWIQLGRAARDLQYCYAWNQGDGDPSRWQPIATKAP